MEEMGFGLVLATFVGTVVSPVIILVVAWNRVKHNFRMKR